MSGNYVGREPASSIANLIGQPNGIAALDAAAKLVKTQLPAMKSVQFTRDVTVASGNQAVVGVGFKPRAILVFATGVNLGSGTLTCSIGFAIDGAPPSNAFLENVANVGASAWAVGAANCIGMVQSGANQYEGKVASFDADGFTIQWTRTGAPVSSTITAVTFCFP